MCYGSVERLPWRDGIILGENENTLVQNLRERLAETEARLERARAREVELNRRLEEMKKFVCVMEILETYLRRRFRDGIILEENENTLVQNLRERLAETEARLERARAREVELNRRLEEMKKFVCVMEILETYLRRRFREQRDHLVRLYSSPSRALVPSK